MGLFTCCINDRKQGKSEAEARHARIVEIYRQAETGSALPTQSPPPSYNEVVFDSLSGTTIIADEKSSQPPSHSAVQPPYARPPISRPSSPRTSIYSVPSTRLTDITSAHTGGTIVACHTHQGDSPRSSLAFDSAPPSYYDGRSMRERSRSPNDQRPSDERQHPVMAEGWWEDLPTAAENDRRHARGA
ncbi:hypothetical protein PMZ80_004523 [Knufia obscura]|uniref:Uncharacterized protein n=2 Tax=Knufia TaxID=430999 RepID=A0AAN8ET21_9EURO|nr:hypothetical protein PMZ80_004523 [Knufia obscura]KAK5951598.1 hypothetical protein OHC33_007276 [Knufia fluminis]